MAVKYERIYQFKISLNDIVPLIWRRIQVPENYSFWDLHVAIQDSMGWLDCHLHGFDILNPHTNQLNYIGIPDDEWGDNKTMPGWEIKIRDYFTEKSNVASYTYDFGDNWEHTVRLEKVLPKEAGVKYPKCIDGARACPPEDCGSVPGYEHLVKLMKKRKGEEYEDMLEWLGEVYDPEAFNPKLLFSSPSQRLKMLLQDN
jgi:hypothetical protein